MESQQSYTGSANVVSGIRRNIVLHTKKTAAAMLYLYPTRCRSVDIPAIFALPSVIRFEDKNIRHKNQPIFARSLPDGIRTLQKQMAGCGHLQKRQKVEKGNKWQEMNIELPQDPRTFCRIEFGVFLDARLCTIPWQRHGVPGGHRRKEHGN